VELFCTVDALLHFTILTLTSLLFVKSESKLGKFMHEDESVWMSDKHTGTEPSSEVQPPVKESIPQGSKQNPTGRLSKSVR
jgi:hypothetical protein